MQIKKFNVGITAKCKFEIIPIFKQLLNLIRLLLKF